MPNFECNGKSLRAGRTSLQRGAHPCSGRPLPDLVVKIFITADAIAEGCAGVRRLRRPVFPIAAVPSR